MASNGHLYSSVKNIVKAKKLNFDAKIQIVNKQLKIS